MRTYIATLIPRIRKFSEKLDNLTLLTNQHWVVIDELRNSKLVYIFRANYDLLIAQDGKVEKGKWEYLGNNSLLIERKNESFLFRHGFFDSNVLALKVDGKDEFAFLVNENKYGGDLNSIEKVLEFLEQKYLKIIEIPEPPEDIIPEPIRDKTPVLIKEISTGETRYISKWEWDDLISSGESTKYELISETKPTYPPMQNVKFIEPNEVERILAELDDFTPVLIMDAKSGYSRYVSKREWMEYINSGESIKYGVVTIGSFKTAKH
ncbi:MAG: hypothetical protein IH597_10175 [Bacteroidales bacterium]|nr:hypothetical protein [Bacteroidales bacterium]